MKKRHAPTLTPSPSAANPFRMILYHPLKRWRFEHGMSMEALSLLCGVSIAAVSQIENKKYYPGAEAIAKLSRVTGLPAEAFLPMEEKAS